MAVAVWDGGDPPETHQLSNEPIWTLIWTFNDLYWYVGIEEQFWPYFEIFLKLYHAVSKVFLKVNRLETWSKVTAFEMVWSHEIQALVPK